MPSARVEINSDAIRELLKSPEVRADLERRGRAIASAAGGAPDYDVETGETGQRARVVVVTATAKARRDEAKHRTLTRALDAGR